MSLLLSMINGTAWGLLAWWLVTAVVPRWKFFADKWFRIVPSLLITTAVTQSLLGALTWWVAVGLAFWAVALPFDKRFKR